MPITPEQRRNVQAYKDDPSTAPRWDLMNLITQQYAAPWEKEEFLNFLTRQFGTIGAQQGNLASDRLNFAGAPVGTQEASQRGINYQNILGLGQASFDFEKFAQMMDSEQRNRNLDRNVQNRMLTQQAERDKWAQWSTMFQPLQTIGFAAGGFGG